MKHQLQQLVAIAGLGAGCVSATPTIEAWGGVAREVGRSSISAPVTTDGARSALVQDRCVPDGTSLVFQVARGQVRELALAVAQLAVERELRVAAEARLAAVMVKRSVVANARVDGWQ